MVDENSSPSRFLKEKRRSAKSDVSKVLFPDIGKITNRFLPCLLLQVAVLRKPENFASYVRHVVRKRLGWGITVACTCAFE